jgi:hypothetical protein
VELPATDEQVLRERTRDGGLKLTGEGGPAGIADQDGGRGRAGMTGQIAHKGDKAPIRARQRWHVERTNAWHNGFSRLQRCYERRANVIDAFSTWQMRSSRSAA